MKSRKNAIFATFRFNTQAFPESGKVFYLRKYQIRIPRHVFIPREVISRKNLILATEYKLGLGIGLSLGLGLGLSLDQA
jgi:hypothetical protein